MNEEPIAENDRDAEQQLLPFDPPLEQPAAPEPSEIEQLRAANAELQLQLRQREARDEMTIALRSAGARSPGLVFEAGKSSLQIGDDGTVANLEAVVAEMKRKYPEQFGPERPPSIDGGAGRDASPAALTKEALAQMKPDEIARLDWERVRQALSN
jgi:hypothetical protein